MNKDSLKKTIEITLAYLFIVALAIQFLDSWFLVLIITVAIIITFFIYEQPDLFNNLFYKSDKPRAQHRIYKFSKEELLNKLKLNPSKVSATKWNSDKQELIVQEDLE